MSKRVNVTLGDEDAAKLTRLAQRAHVSDGTLARSLLISAIEEADPDVGAVTRILEGVPGLPDRIEAAERQIERGEYSELSELA